jgi:hypothetical protein
MITITREGDDMVVENGSSTICISELRVRSSNRGHLLMGKSGSSMYLTDKELLTAVFEYIFWKTSFSEIERMSR